MTSGTQGARGCRQCALRRKRIAELEGELERMKARDDGGDASFRRLADASPVMIWMAGPDALRTYCNRAWLKFRGRSMAEELGNGWIEGVHPDDRGLCVETYLKSFAAREAYQIEYRLRRADGEYRSMADRGVPLPDEAGGFAGFGGAAIEIGAGRHRGFTPDEKALRIVLTLTERERQVLVLVAEGQSTSRSRRPAAGSLPTRPTTAYLGKGQTQPRISTSK